MPKKIDDKQDRFTKRIAYLEERIQKLDNELEKEKEHRLRLESILLKKEAKIIDKDVALRQILAEHVREKSTSHEIVRKKIENLIFPMIDLIIERGYLLRDKIYLEALQDSMKVILRSLDSTANSKMEKLSSRELEICNLTAKGCTSEKIGKMLSLSVHTVHTHRKNIRKKLGVKRRNINLATYLKSME